MMRSPVQSFICRNGAGTIPACFQQIGNPDHGQAIGTDPTVIVSLPLQ